MEVFYFPETTSEYHFRVPFYFFGQKNIKTSINNGYNRYNIQISNYIRGKQNHNQTESIVTNGETPQATNAGRKKKETIYTVKASGPVELVDNMGKGLMQELTSIFGIADAKFIYMIALLRAAFGEIKNRNLDEEYEASVMYP